MAALLKLCKIFQVKELEERLENEALHKEIHNLRQQLELLEDDKRELEQKYQSSEEKARNLKHSGESPEAVPVSFAVPTTECVCS